MDLRILKDSLISAEWFLSRRDLLGGYTGNDFKNQTIGSHYRLRELDALNVYLDAYNSENNPETKTRIKKYLREKQFWHPAGDRVKNTLYFLENMAKTSGDFVSSLEST